jgi:pyridoxal biosynthesis lyase PdxS
MLARSGAPFFAGSREVAGSREALRPVLQALADERAPSEAVTGSKVHTAASLRKVYGAVPAGVREGEGRLYAAARIGEGLVVLTLTAEGGRWRVTGISR